MTIQLNLTEGITRYQKDVFSRLDKLRTQFNEKRAAIATLQEEVDQITRDIAVLNETLEVEARMTGTTEVEPHSNGTTRLIGIGLREAVGILRSEFTDITKKDILRRLQDIGFDFKGKKPGNAVHMAWISLDRRK